MTWQLYYLQAWALFMRPTLKVQARSHVKTHKVFTDKPFICVCVCMRVCRWNTLHTRSLRHQSSVKCFAGHLGRIYCVIWFITTAVFVWVAWTQLRSTRHGYTWPLQTIINPGERGNRELIEGYRHHALFSAYRWEPQDIYSAAKINIRVLYYIRSHT